MTVQREIQGGKAGEDSHGKFNTGSETGRPWLDFWKVTTTDHDSAGNSVLVTAMFCKWCEMTGFKHNDRGKPTVWTGAGGGCQRAHDHVLLNLTVIILSMTKNHDYLLLFLHGA